jgi:hypothetical protein
MKDMPIRIRIDDMTSRIKTTLEFLLLLCENNNNELQIRIIKTTDLIILDIIAV